MIDFMTTIMKFINENTYIVVAMKGENYTTSAKIVSEILMSKSSYFIFSQTLSNLFSILGRILIAFICI